MKTIVRKTVPAGSGAFWLVILSVCFLVGSVLGTLAACGADEPAGSALTEAATGFLDRAAAGQREPLDLVLLETAVIPAAVFFCGFCVFGGILCGGLCLTQGFLLSFCSAILMRIQGSAGLAGAACFYGVPALLSVPVLLLLGARASMTAGELWRLSLGRRALVTPPLYGRDCWLSLVLCIPLLVLAGLYEVFLAPGVWKGMLALIS